MSRKTRALILIVLLCIPLYAPKEEKIVLPEKYKKWLEEEVVYIITSGEKKVFLALKTNRERDVFIEAFWKQRDPTPRTPRNEYYEEHYRRFHYANEFFGRGTPRPGWKTDQGRIYIILGPPKSIEKFENVLNVYPTQIWFYQGEPKYELPSAFNVIFFKKRGIGEYELYSPSDHGPQSLIADYMENAANIEEAYQRLRELEPNLAKQTLSLIPGERPAPALISLASNRLLNNIESSPHKRVEDEYAEAFLKYKDIVEVEYTANYINSDSMVRIMRDPLGFYLIHYSIEPKKLSVDFFEDKYTAHLELDGRIYEEDGRTIFQYTKEFPLSFNRDQLKEMESKSLALQDMIPLVPGQYRFSLLLKNTVSKEFTSMESKITVPPLNSKNQMSALILGYRAEKLADPLGDFIPFKFGENQILCQSRNIFTAKDDLFIYFQVYGLSDKLSSQGILKFTLFKSGEEYFSKTKKISNYPSKTNLIEKFPLENYPSGYYKIKVSVLDEEENELFSESENFEITYAENLPRPLIISKVMPVSRVEEYLYSLGVQQLNKGEINDALVLLEEAYNRNPGQLKYALGLSQGLFIKEEFNNVKAILNAFLDRQNDSSEILYFLGKSSQALSQYEEAISHYKGYLSNFGLNLEVLNLLGECYYKLGDTKEALRIWQRSLEINPDQDEIKNLVKSLREKK